MDRQPKTEIGSPPKFGSSNLSRMNVRELVSVLRTAYKVEDFDSVEEVLVSKEERLNVEIDQLREKLEKESIARFHAEEEFRKRNYVREEKEHNRIMKHC